MVEPEWIANRDRHLSHTNTAGISEARPRKAGGINPKHGEIRIPVATNDSSGCESPVRQRYSQTAVTFDHVAVRQHETVWREDDARAATSSGIDTNDGRADLFGRSDHRLRIRVEKRSIVCRGGALRKHAGSVVARRARHITQMGVT
jgi:hypothetical protein